VLGTPNEEVWPGVTSLPDWNEDFPVWPSLLLSRFCPGLSESGVDLLEVRVYATFPLSPFCSILLSRPVPMWHEICVLWCWY
jgi:hypothetical protein